MLVGGCETLDDSSSVRLPDCYRLPAGTHLPRLAQTPDGPLLSYVASGPDGDTLLLTRPAARDQRDVSVALADGGDWFVNWADFPSVAYVDDGPHGDILFHHHLRYSAAGTYDYDIIYGVDDGGGPFATARKLHTDTVHAEHGFVSTAALPGGDLRVTWLDGRYTKAGAAAGAGEGPGAEDDHGHAASAGAMTLRTKTLFSGTATELDHRVCDCCNTATVANDSLTLVAYRDRSEHEIRDIAYVVRRHGDSSWSTPKLVHADNWEISGCPVNGPALAAAGPDHLAVIWYTAPRGRAQVLFSRYDMVLDAWSPPVLLDDNAPYGRVDLQLAPDGTAYATALTATDDPETAELTLWTIKQHRHNQDGAGGNIERSVLTTTSPARSSGFPKIMLYGRGLFWARTAPRTPNSAHYVEVCRRLVR